MIAKSTEHFYAPLSGSLLPALPLRGQHSPSSASSAVMGWLSVGHDVWRHCSHGLQWITITHVAVFKYHSTRAFEHLYFKYWVIIDRASPVWTQTALYGRQHLPLNSQLPVLDEYLYAVYNHSEPPSDNLLDRRSLTDASFQWPVINRFFC